MTPRLLIGTPLGLGIRDPAWFEHRLALLSAITAPSLMAQEDQNFEWALLVDSGPPAGVRKALEDVLAPFEGRAFLHPQEMGRSGASLLALAQERELIGAGGYILTGRIDDDDAWATHTVGEVHRRVDSWLRRRNDTPGFGLTFENGLVWIMYDMYDIAHLHSEDQLVMRRAGARPFSCSFPSMSGFVCSRLSEGITAVSQSHAQLPKRMASKGFAVDCISTEAPMWLYCRHKQAGGSIDKAPGADAMEVDVADLARTFGLDEARTKQYISNAESYGYSRSLHHFHRHRDLWVALQQVNEKLKDPKASSAQLAQLEREKAKLKEERTRAFEQVVDSPGEIPKAPTER